MLSYMARVFTVAYLFHVETPFRLTMIGFPMRNFRLFGFLFLLGAALPSLAADVRVIVSSDIRPGVYGRVDFVGAQSLPMVYPEPQVIYRQPREAQLQPVYLHVPPGHAKDWGKHCRKYNACNVPVYFVKSAEYETKADKKDKKDKKEKKEK